MYKENLICIFKGFGGGAKQSSLCLLWKNILSVPGLKICKELRADSRGNRTQAPSGHCRRPGVEMVRGQAVESFLGGCRGQGVGVGSCLLLPHSPSNSFKKSIIHHWLPCYHFIFPRVCCPYLCPGESPNHKCLLRFCVVPLFLRHYDGCIPGPSTHMPVVVFGAGMLHSCPPGVSRGSFNSLLWPTRHLLRLFLLLRRAIPSNYPSASS